MKKYYNLNNIKKLNASYNFIFVERLSGKRFACLEKIIKNYLKYNKQEDDFRGDNEKTLHFE